MGNWSYIHVTYVTCAGTEPGENGSFVPYHAHDAAKHLEVHAVPAAKTEIQMPLWLIMCHRGKNSLCRSTLVYIQASKEARSLILLVIGSYIIMPDERIFDFLYLLALDACVLHHEGIVDCGCHHRWSCISCRRPIKNASQPKVVFSSRDPGVL